jgi:predicted short-subunit dehydrogenase-like oxidoreductase (DUF2520 family)
MNIVIIGGGRAGTSIGKNLQQSKSFSVKAVTCITVEEAKQSADFIGNVEFISDNNMEALKYGNIILISTPDDIIESVADDISKSDDLQGKYFFHVSGSRPSTILEKVKKRGAFIGSIHPLQALPSFVEGAENLKTAYFCLEGDDEAVEISKKMVSEISNKYFTILSEYKALYHAAAVFASNFINATTFAAFSILKEIGIREDEIINIVLPLIKGTVNNIERLGFIDSLTGPISRGDTKTIKRHLQGLENYDKERLLLYKALSKEAVKITEIRDKNINLKEINELIKD